MTASPFTNFHNNPVGSGVPSGWSHALQAGFNVSVAQDSDGDRYMRLQKSGDGHDGVKWTAQGTHTNVELYCEWMSNAGSALSNRLKLMARGVEDTSGSNHLRYGAGMGQSTNRRRIVRYTPTFAQIASDGAQQFSAGTTIRMRYRIQGGTHSLKVWAKGTREPRLWYTAIDTSLTSGGILGLFSFGSSSAATDIRIYKFSALLLDHNPALPEAHAEPPHSQYNSPPHEIGYLFTQEKDQTIWWPDGWIEDRDGGNRTHRAIDIYDYPGSTPVKGAHIYSVSDGTIAWRNDTFTPGVGGGYALHVDHPSGDVRFAYLHMGNDDGGGNPAAAFGINPRTGNTWAVGNTIYKHELIGYLGDSGVTGSGPHLHFEYRSRVANTPSDDRWSDPSATPGTANFLRWSPVTALWDARVRNDYPNFVPVNPPQVQNLRMTNRTVNSISVAWDAVSYSGGTLNDYQLQRKLSSASSWTTISSGQTTLTFIDSGRAPGTSYDYRVRARGTGDPLLNGDWSTLLTVSTTTVPSAPTSLSVSDVTDNAITLNWQPPTNDGGHPVNGYVVSAQNSNWNNGNPWLTTVSGSSLFYRFTDLLPESNYSFTVAATNSAGVGSVATTTATTAIGEDNPFTYDPTNLTLAQEGEAVRLNCDPSSTPEVEEYIWFRRSPATTEPFDPYDATLLAITSGTTYLDEDVSIGVEYEYQAFGRFYSEPAPSPKTVLFITSDNAGNLPTSEQVIIDRLELLGHTVEVRHESAADNWIGIDLVVSGKLTDWLSSTQRRNPPVGVVALDTWRNWGMGNTIGFNNTGNTVDVVGTSSELAAGLSGTVPVYVNNQWRVWSTDHNASAFVIARTPGVTGSAYAFAYEAGSTMTNGFATTRHVGLGLHMNGRTAGLTNEGWALFDAAVNWALATVYVEPPEPSEPVPSENLAMLATDAELAMWRHRKDNGPFQVANDFSSNSPGHWTEMNATLSMNFSGTRWDGPQHLGSDGRVLKHGDGGFSGTGNDPAGGFVGTLTT